MIRTALQILCALAALAIAPYALAQADAPEPPAPPVAGGPDEAELAAYLEPLKALEGDQAAFADRVWDMGNAEFKKLDENRTILANPQSSNDSKIAASREIRVNVARLEALAAYGVERFENNPRLRNFRGNVYYDVLDKQVEGVKEWHTAVSLDSKYADPYNNLGMHYFHVGRYPLGFQNMDMALKLDPKSPDFCFNMAQNYLIYRPQTESHRGWPAEKVYKEAMKLSKKAVKLAPKDYELLQDYAVNFLAAQNFGVEPNWKEAVKAWRAARVYARTDEERFFTWMNEGRAWRSMGKKGEAIAAFQEALKIIPESEVARNNIARLEAGE
ncbi:MAG: tetratricopeptide repeat protein [Candidatus Hydrogenedentes bacterium]|nr:tetratricopeptide repeat protein [Candidatus Hydrogenedentota bacterium]